jgi:hypothetical protein
MQREEPTGQRVAPQQATKIIISKISPVQAKETPIIYHIIGEQQLNRPFQLYLTLSRRYGE